MPPMASGRRTRKSPPISVFSNCIILRDAIELSHESRSFASPRYGGPITPARRLRRADFGFWRSGTAWSGGMTLTHSGSGYLSGGLALAGVLQADTGVRASLTHFRDQF